MFKDINHLLLFKLEKQHYLRSRKNTYSVEEKGMLVSCSTDKDAHRPEQDSIRKSTSGLTVIMHQHETTLENWTS